MQVKNTLNLFIVVNVDWFFLSHRLPIALAAKKAGYNVTIVSSDTGHSSTIRGHGLAFIEAPFTRSGVNMVKELSLVKFLTRLYAIHKPDILHHVTLKPAIYGSLAAKRVGIKNVINAISGLGYNFTAGRKGIKQFILTQLLKASFKSKDLRFIFQNPDDTQMFKDLKLITRDDQITLIKGSGVDLNAFPFSSEPDTKVISVLLPARMLYDKGVLEFVNAAVLLKNEYKDRICFNLAGDFDPENPAGIAEHDLKALLDPPYINWIGFQKSMSTVLAAHHIIILPSYREGLPKALIEACAIGRSIITTDVPGCRECVVEGYNGFLVPVKDHVLMAQRITELINSAALREKMGYNSREYAEENFSIETVVDQTLGLYSKLAAK